MAYIEVKLEYGWYKEFEEKRRVSRERIERDGEGMYRKYVVLPLGEGCCLEVSGPWAKGSGKEEV